MAEGPDVKEKPLEELEKEITCAVCHEHYQRAKLLPCNHYYCESCIESLAKHSRRKPFDCPECRKAVVLPSGGVAGLDGAFFVERMKDLYVKMAKAEGKVEAMCEQCVGGGKAVAFCRQCAEFICSECERFHRTRKVYAGHTVSTLTDLKSGGAKCIPLKEDPLSKCPEHDEPMKIFCFDCNRIVCRDCVLYDHREHKSDFVKKSASETRKTLLDALGPLRQIQAGFTSAEDTVLAEKDRVSTQNVAICKSIQQCFDKMKALLDQRKKELVKQANKLAQGKKEALTVQMKGLQVAQSEIQSLVEFVERNFANTSDRDLMSIHTQLQAKITEGRECDWKVCLHPTTTADVVCNLPPLETIPRDLGAVFTVHIDPPATSSVGEPTQFSVKVSESIGSSVQVQLKSLVDPSCIVQASISGHSDTYVVTYTPKVRGRHSLIVKVDGREITGSPFQVFVKIHPTLLGKPVRVIDQLNNPWEIAVTHNQQLVVTERAGKNKVTVMERDGTRVQTIECEHFQNLNGVATGPDGAIYVSDVYTKCLFKFSKDGKLLCRKARVFKWPLFVNIINDKVYVSDMHANK